MIRKTMSLVFCAVLLCAGGAFAAYIEGIDTTDVNGYSRDSAFRVTSSTITGQNIVRYWFDEYSATGYFNCGFDDIKQAPLSTRQAYGSTFGKLNYCFVIKRNKDNTYSKVKILQLISGNRYLYRYGTNTTPNDRLLTNPVYDPSIRYKPNNFCNFLGVIYPPALDTAYWEAPLPNNNHLLGYIYYRAKSGVTIDTSAAINLAQWDSVAFVTATWSNKFSIPYVWNLYFNLVAVYTEGKSVFLLGWTKNNYNLVGVKQGAPAAVLVPNTLAVRKTSGGFEFSLLQPGKNTGIVSLTVFNATGVTMARFPAITSSRIVWNTTDREIPEGLFIVKAEMPDRSAVTRTVVFTK